MRLYNVKIFLLLLFSVMCKNVEAQIDINKYDLSKVWMAGMYHGIWQEGDEERIKPEPLGFIGDNYQRLYIHFISIIKIPDSTNRYMVYGKTKVRNIIRDFHGTIKVTETKLHGKEFSYQTGTATCDVNLYEDGKQTSTGSIIGTLQTKFVIDKKDIIAYDGTHYISDGFHNNQFTGIWTSYKTAEVKKFHFGDYRIPGSGDLDIGAGEFSVNEKYIKSGWENYVKAWSGTDPKNEDVKKARQEEERNWWKD